MNRGLTAPKSLTIEKTMSTGKASTGGPLEESDLPSSMQACTIP